MTFDTTPVIVGIIRDPVTNAVIFDPTSFDPVNDVLPQATIDAINAAIAHQAALRAGAGRHRLRQPGRHACHDRVRRRRRRTPSASTTTRRTLRLEGEADNDEFVVRAFVTLDLSAQGDTEVNGGDGTDTINYAINAPVSIDGGAGFDKVVVLGTPFNDNFVVTSQGIFGAGLNVTFVNVESAELDTLEGNDTIYVLGTSPDIVTTVIGGLGSDTIQVMGDVTLPIVSNEQGRSGVITQGLSSNDPTYRRRRRQRRRGERALGCRRQPGQDPADRRAAARDRRRRRGVLLHQPGRAERRQRSATTLCTSRCRREWPAARTAAIGGAGVLVSTDDVTFTNAVVLEFDGTTANEAVPDLGQGDRRLRRRRAARRADQPQHHQQQPGVRRPAADRHLRQRRRQRPAGPRYPAPDRDGPECFRAGYEHRSPGRRIRLQRRLLGRADDGAGSWTKS